MNNYFLCIKSQLSRNSRLTIFIKVSNFEVFKENAEEFREQLYW